jgi:N-acetylglutamate synthase-like GNAT family acetyltransferase
MARLDGHPVGCGVLKRKNPTTGEIKRMWTASYARGRGVALKILHTLETIAREAGLTVLHLETNRTFAEAQALYRKDGYIEVDAFNDENPTPIIGSRNTCIPIPADNRGTPAAPRNRGMPKPPIRGSRVIP